MSYRLEPQTVEFAACVFRPQSHKVWIDRQEFEVKAKTYTLHGYSAHADQSDLLRFVQGIPIKPAEIRLVHGEANAKATLAEKLTSLDYKVT